MKNDRLPVLPLSEKSHSAQRSKLQSRLLWNSDWVQSTSARGLALEVKRSFCHKIFFEFVDFTGVHPHKAFLYVLYM